MILILKEFFGKNPKHFNNVRSELANEGVFIPEFKDLKWSVITASDFALVNSIVKDTNLREALKLEYVQKLFVGYFIDKFILYVYNCSY